MAGLLLELEPWREEGNVVEVAAVLKNGGIEKRMWWRIPAEWKNALTPWADPFVVGFIFQMMEAGQDVEVRGKVSGSLLANLEAYMGVWRIWVPEKYKLVQISATEEIEKPPAPTDRVIIPFSGGCDSCFTLYRHTAELAGRANRKIGAALTMHGFDVRRTWKQGEVIHEDVKRRVRHMLTSRNIPGIELVSNFRELGTKWLHSHGSHLGAALHLFGSGFAGALIPNSVTHFQLSTLWGSHPMIDPLMSSRNFPIADDGAAFSRADKMPILAKWKEGLQEMKVCFGHKGNVGNCGICEKCLRTMMAFNVAGVPLPLSFKKMRLSDVRKIRIDSEIGLQFWRELLQGARLAGKARQPWAREIAAVVRRTIRRRKWRAMKEVFVPIRNRVRKIFRGSELSKNQLAELKGDLDRP